MYISLYVGIEDIIEMKSQNNGCNTRYPDYAGLSPIECYL